MSYTAKTFVLDVADNHGGTLTGIRSIDFKLNGSVVAVASGDITTYGATPYGIFTIAMAFITALSKTGSAYPNSWMIDEGEAPPMM